MELVNHLKTTFDSKAAVLVCLFFVGVVNIPGAGELVLALIAVLGIAFTIKHRINPLTDPDLKLFSWLVLAVVGSKLLSILVNEPGPRTYGNLGTSIHFLLAPFVATYLCKERWNKGSIWIGIKSGAILAGIIALAQPGRAGGAVNAIVFGDIVLLLAFMSIVRLPLENGRERVISIIAFVMGIIAVILSQTRGAWIAMPLLLGCLLYCWVRMNNLRVSGRLALAVTLIVLLFVGAVSQTDQFQNRMAQVSDQVEKFEKGSQFTSVGLRLAIWYGAAEVWRDKVFLGHGPANGSGVVSEHVSPEVKQKVASFSHLHNEYITVFVEQGVMGLIIVLLLLGVPILISLRNIHYKVTPDIACCALLVASGYSVFGLTNLAFGHGVMNSFYVLLMAALLPLIRAAQLENVVTDGTKALIERP